MENKLKKIELDENGLHKNVEYFFNEHGGIDWRKMIPAKFLYVNNDLKNRSRLEKKYGKPYDQIDPIKDNVEDIDLVQTLAAAKYLFHLRMPLDIKYTIKEANENYAAVNCRIVFRGNYQSLGEPVPFEDNACANLNNTNNFGQKYLLEMATNRSFVRCVRNCLGISIVSKEEILAGVSENDSDFLTSAPNPQVEILQNLLNKKHMSFDQFKKARLIPDNIPGAENMKSLNDLPKDIIFNYISRIKQKTPE
jgi:hypothetical protein